MSTDTADLTKVDSAVSGLSSSPIEEKKGHRRASSSAAGVYNINDLEKEGKELQIAKETQKLNWKLNTSPATLDDKDTLKKFLTIPPVKKIDLHFPLGLEADDELDLPVLAGFEWDSTISWTSLLVHQKKEGAPAGGGKKKNKKGDSDE
ncbi:MAG: hypothetical protein LQ352_001306 [Teloschistes flavicans]|nr:MAG: hypothetical protein LQ352_001306 [Teloschistes flavicans]